MWNQRNTQISLLVILATFSSLITGQLRLTGGSGPHEGNVEVLFNKTTWKYICDDRWDMRDAKVVCRELGYATAIHRWTRSYFPVRESTKGLDYNSTYFATVMRCVGDERKLRYCEIGHPQYDLCEGNANAAGVTCSNKTDHIQLEPKTSHDLRDFGIR